MNHIVLDNLDSPEEENFALGVDDDGKGGQTRELTPEAQV